MNKKDSTLPSKSLKSTNVIDISYTSSQHKFSSLLQSGIFSDFILIYSRKGELRKEFKVHKNILYSTSEYFHNLFESDWKEKDSTELSLANVIPYEAYQIFLNYLYTDQYPIKIPPHWSFYLYRLGDYYLVPRLKKDYLEKLRTTISLKNVDCYIKFTKETNDHEEIADILINFVAENFRELSSQKFPFHELGELINRVFESICDDYL